MKKWKRNCPKCKKELFYINKNNRNRAMRENTNCLSCKMTGKFLSEETRKKMSESHKGKKLSEEHKKNISDANKGKKRTNETKNKIRKANIGKKLSVKTRQKISEVQKGKKSPMYGKNHTEETKRKIREKRKLQIMKPHSDETRRKMRLSTIKRIEINKFNGNQMSPNYNPKTIPIIDEYGKKYNFNFQHAENGGEVCIDGYWPDGLDEKRKTIIEIDEKQHFNGDGTYKQKDIDRQKYLEKKGYKIIRVKV